MQIEFDNNDRRINVYNEPHYYKRKYYPTLRLTICKECSKEIPEEFKMCTKCEMRKEWLKRKK